MAKTKKQKQDMLKQLEDKITKAKSLVFVGYDKVKINDQDTLRKGLKKDNGELLVAKKTLLRLALKNLKIADSKDLGLENETALVFGYNDEVAPARLIAQIAKKAVNLKIKGGILEKKLVSAEKIKFLSTLPSREILQAKLVGTLKSPVFGLVNVLQGNLRGMVYVLRAISQKN